MTTDTDTDIEAEQASGQIASETSIMPETMTDAERGDEADDKPDVGAADQNPDRKRRLRLPVHRQALLAGLAIVLVLGGLTGWLGWKAYQSHQLAHQRAEFLQAGRQGALNLTTIDWQNADADVARILNSATGTFYDDFSKRSKPFADVLKQTQSKSEGTISAAGLESVSGTQAQLLVVVSVKISNSGAPEQKPRLWRMRISVQKAGQDVKVSNVEFVP